MNYLKLLLHHWEHSQITSHMTPLCNTEMDIEYFTSTFLRCHPAPLFCDVIFDIPINSKKWDTFWIGVDIVSFVDVSNFWTGNNFHLSATHPDPKRELNVFATPDLKNKI